MKIEWEVTFCRMLCPAQRKCPWSAQHQRFEDYKNADCWCCHGTTSYAILFILGRYNQIEVSVNTCNIVMRKDFLWQCS